MGLLCAVGAALALGQPAGAAEHGWVRGAPLNLRSGPGTEFRILGVAKPGDRLEILERGDGWTQVRTPDAKQGWMAAGYLDPTPPPRVRLVQLGAEVERLRSALEKATREASEARSRAATLSSADAKQREAIARLTKDNTRLRAGERWAEWITGALILSSGLVGGGILSSLSRRRSRPRLRL